MRVVGREVGRRNRGRGMVVVTTPPSVCAHKRMSGVVEEVRGDEMMWVWHAIVTVVIVVVMCLHAELIKKEAKS